MFRDFWKKTFDKKAGELPQTRYEIGEGMLLCYNETSNGYGGYSKTDLCLADAASKKKLAVIIDGKGRIQNFPGVLHGEWKKDLEYPLDARVRFSFRVGKFENGVAPVAWTLQPDGRYFEDEDGFGAENCREIILCSTLDKSGRFLEKFKSE